MKKPLNKIALALWIIAALFVLVQAWSLVEMFRTSAEIGKDQYFLVLGSVSRLVQSAVIFPAVLTGMGALIELVDQIRWAFVRAPGKT